MDGLKSQITVKVTFRKEIENDETMYSPPIYFNYKTQIVFSDLGINDSLTTSDKIILSRIQKWVGESSSWIIESVDGEYIDISFHNPLIGSSYIKLPEELRNSRKDLISIQSENNECFFWCHMRHFNTLKKIFN